MQGSTKCYPWRNDTQLDAKNHIQTNINTYNAEYAIITSSLTKKSNLLSSGLIRDINNKKDEQILKIQRDLSKNLWLAQDMH